jgi:hypothetical protein
MTPTLFPWLVGAFLVAYVARKYYSYQKLSHLKGPPIAAVSSLWLVWQAITARMPVAQKEALRRYGEVLAIFRITPLMH